MAVWLSVLIMTMVAAFIFYSHRYPISVTMFVAVTAVFISLTVVALTVFFSDNLTRKLVRILFPRGHPIREIFHL